MRVSPLIGAYFLLSLSLGATELGFDQPHVEVMLPIDVQEAEVAFPFKNKSATTIKILEIRTECDCIKSSIPTHAIGANETGVLSLNFHSKLRNGTEVVRAKVVADNGETHEISVSAKLRSYIDVKPLSLHWMKGEKRDAKEFIVSSTGLAKLQFTKVAAVNDSKLELLRDSDPATIRVRVIPPAGDRPFHDILVVSAVVEGTNETKIYDLQVRVE
jgi:hypothetical protein